MSRAATGRVMVTLTYLITVRVYDYDVDKILGLLPILSDHLQFIPHPIPQYFRSLWCDT